MIIIIIKMYKQTDISLHKRIYFFLSAQKKDEISHVDGCVCICMYIWLDAWIAALRTHKIM